MSLLGLPSLIEAIEESLRRPDKCLVHTGRIIAADHGSESHGLHGRIAKHDPVTDHDTVPDPNAVANHDAIADHDAVTRQLASGQKHRAVAHDDAVTDH